MRLFFPFLSLLSFTLLSINTLSGQSLSCPQDTTISCSVLIDPEFTGVPDDTGLDSLYFVDTTLQTCPGDIIIQRSWIATLDSITTDTCRQLITIEVESIDDLVTVDTLRIQDACSEDVDEMIQTTLDLPCNLGIDSVSVELIEDSCERSVISASWVFGDQCRDTSVTINQILVLENKKVQYLDAPTITQDTGSSSGSITLIETCESEEDFNYVWSDQSTSPNLTGVAAGDYSVTISNNLGCEQVETYMVGATSVNDNMAMDSIDMMMDSTVMMMDSTDMMMDSVIEETIDTVGLDSLFSISILDRDDNTLSVDSIYFLAIDSTVINFEQLQSDSNQLTYRTGESILLLSQVCIELDDVAIRDVSVQDIRIGQLLILQQINGCIEDRIAGDVNGSNTLSGADLVSMRNVILEKEEAFPIGRTWRFVRADINEPTIQLCVPVNNADKNRGQLEVRALKVGDLKCNE